jgi:hypothetical protein
VIGEVNGFWKWLYTNSFRFTGVLDFVHHPELNKLEQDVSETESVSVLS